MRNAQRERDGPMTDPFYKSALWRRLRTRVVRRLRVVFKAPGCTQNGVLVDHTFSRQRGGPDDLRQHTRQNYSEMVKWYLRIPAPTVLLLAIPVVSSRPGYSLSFRRVRLLSFVFQPWLAQVTQLFDGGIRPPQI